MKRCLNPNCESTFLFGNDKTVCPFCHSVLAENMNDDLHPPWIIPPDTIFEGNDREQNGNVNFIRSRLGGIECHGRIIEIDHQALFNDKKHKLFNAVFRGEPYQLAHQTIEYTIRVENITDDISDEVTDFCLYGSYLGRLQVGDEVLVKAKNFRDRRVVKSIYNETIGTTVKPGLQIPAEIIRGIILVFLFILLALMCGIVWMFKSGAIAVFVSALIAAIMPIVIVCIGFWWIVKSIFRRHRR